MSLFIIKKTSSHIFVLTSEGKENLINLGFRKDRITVSGAAVTVQSFKKVKKHKRLYDFLFVGRLNKTKGIYDALKVLKVVRKNFNDVKMAVIGSSSEHELAKINSYVVKNRLSKNFVYLGYVDNNMKIELMRSTPILIAPSHEEGFGIGVLEGIANGMKVAAYDLTVYGLIFQKYKDRILYSKLGDISSLASSICKLLEEKPTSNTPIKVSTWKDVARIQYDIIRSSTY